MGVVDPRKRSETKERQRESREQVVEPDGVGTQEIVRPHVRARGSASGDCVSQTAAAASSSSPSSSGAVGTADSNLPFPLPWKTKHRPVVPSISLQLSSEDGNSVTTSEKPTNNSNAEEEDPVAAGDTDPDESLAQSSLQESSFLDTSVESDLNMTLATLSISNFSPEYRGSRRSQDTPDRLDSSFDEDVPSSDDMPSSSLYRKSAASHRSSDDEAEKGSSPPGPKKEHSKSPKGSKRDPKPSNK
ncbi:hypothetical protein BSL78_11461 [Apostichopus japonicus]|uniref:Uncharacterized protein n=1 Tax=Stichopus japonicus TaxID=307972 RepID=A0A2G8KUI0_STIJA|nr:hypothetical protein BSL78_11461 [Apostichopus japonicus]